MSICAKALKTKVSSFQSFCGLVKTVLFLFSKIYSFSSSSRVVADCVLWPVIKLRGMRGNGVLLPFFEGECHAASSDGRFHVTQKLNHKLNAVKY